MIDLDVTEKYVIWSGMTTPLLPPRSELSDRLLAIIDELNGRGVSVRSIEIGAVVNRGVIARLRSGKGITYDTAYKLESYLVAFRAMFAEGAA